MVAQYKAWVCGRTFTGILGSNPTWGLDVCLLWVLCVFRFRSLRWVDHSSRGVLPNVVCLSMIVKPWHWGGLGPLGLSSHGKKITVVYAGMGLDFHQTLYIQILGVKGRIAFQWVFFAATTSEYLSDKKDSKTI